MKLTLNGKIDRIGQPEARLEFHDHRDKSEGSVQLNGSDYRSASHLLIDWLETHTDFKSIVAVGHRVVHGMQHIEPEFVTTALLDELRQIVPNDPDHLPGEIELFETIRQRHPQLAQLACFDTAFHRTMLRVAKLLPIPRRFDAKGVQRYGFHGLSFSYLMEELTRVAGENAAKAVTFLLTWEAEQAWRRWKAAAAWTQAWASRRRQGW